METKEFTLEEATQIFKNEECYDKSGDLKEPVATKAYIDKYFFPTNKGSYYVWDASVNDFEYFEKGNIRTVYFDKLPEEIKKWFFFKNLKLYKVICDFHKPRFDKNTINLFQGIPHQKKAYADYPEATRQKVDVFLKFMFEVISSSQEKVYQYLLKWLSVMVKGGKNDTALYLKGIKRIGKSTFTDFIAVWVLGFAIALVTSSTEPLLTNYNKILCGKLLVVFEELPALSEREWNAMSGKLKQMITGASLVYRDVYEKPFPAANGNNYIINANDEAIKHSEEDRYAIVPVSTHRKGDHKYFGDIMNQCFNKEVGEAFYNYLLEIDTKDFRAQKDLPDTRNKRDAIAERLDVEYRFLKDNYILKNKGVSCLLKELCLEYNKYCDYVGRKPLSKYKFSAKLTDIGINSKISHGQTKYEVPLADLKKIADKNKWIHELDEVPEEPKEDPLEHGTQVPWKVHQELKKELESLKEENEGLKELACKIPEPVDDMEEYAQLCKQFAMIPTPKPKHKGQKKKQSDTFTPIETAKNTEIYVVADEDLTLDFNK